MSIALSYGPGQGLVDDQLGRLAVHLADTLALEAETAWRLWTKGIRPDTAQAATSISGDRALGLPILDAVAIIG